MDWTYRYRPEEAYTEDYHPFQAGNLLASVQSPTISISENYPRLDGATAAYPIYAAAVQAIYKNLPASESIFSYVRSSTTPEAFRKLLDGDVDLIFTAHPSDEQVAEAAARGISYQLTPLGREAFVFFVHENSAINALSTEQIRGIYTKRIRNWKELGGPDQTILSFQRPKGSGSQTAMERMVMRGEPLPAPLREEFVRGMGGIVQRVALYRNYDEAIGYSFRIFATTMNPAKKIKLLSVDGLEPSAANIRSGAYPYTADIYAVTAGTKNPHAAELIGWFLSSQGQQLIEDTGYVGLRKE